MNACTHAHAHLCLDAGVDSARNVAKGMQIYVDMCISDVYVEIYDDVDACRDVDVRRYTFISDIYVEIYDDVDIRGDMQMYVDTFILYCIRHICRDT